MKKTTGLLSKDRIKSETKAPIRKDYRNTNDKSGQPVKKTDYLTESKRFKKGNPGRPKGSHKGYTLTDLQKAIKRVEKKRKIKYFEHMIEKSLDEPSIFIAILKRLVAEMKLSDDDGIKFINIIRNGSPASNSQAQPEPIKQGEPDAKV